MIIYRVKIFYDFENELKEKVDGKILYGIKVNGVMVVYIDDYGLHYIASYSRYEIISEIDLESLEAKLDPRRESPLMSAPSLQKYIGEGLSKLTVEFK